jgi:hypothetical protein
MFTFVLFITKNAINLHGNYKYKTNFVRFFCMFFAKLVNKHMN